MRLKDLEGWLTAADVARIRGVSRQRIHQLLNDGKYRAVKTRLGFLIDPESVDQRTGEDRGRFGESDSKLTRS